jgi:hypothetical protein
MRIARTGSGGKASFTACGRARAKPATAGTGRQKLALAWSPRQIEQNATLSGAEGAVPPDFSDALPVVT